MNNLTVKIFSLEQGLKIYKEVTVLRIKSAKYNLLIMEDYMPIIGEIDGELSFEKKEETIRLEGIKGYYMHRENEFTLVLDE